METTEESMTRAQRTAVAATAVLVALTRFVPLSKGPWDWDEVLFCMAVGDYNVLAHQPHPPGFPLYVFLGKLARAFTGSDFHALQTVNVVFAMLVFPAMFWIGRSFRLDFRTSYWAALLFSFLPNVWFFGGTAFSDVPAMVLFLATIAAYLRAGLSARRYLLASVIFAAALLVRPQNAIVAVYPWALATWELWRAKRLRTIVAGAFTTGVITLAGYGFAAWATGGIHEYFDAFYRHSQYVRQADSVDSPVRPPLLKVIRMYLDPYIAGKVSILVNLLALLAIVRGDRRAGRKILLTFLPFVLFAMVAVNPLGSSRFSLNYMAGIVLLAAMGTTVLARIAPRLDAAVRAVVLLVIAGRLITWVLPAFEHPRNHDAPPVQAAQWVAAHVPKTSVVFVDESIWPWAKYFIPDHQQVRPHDPSRILNDEQASSGVYVTMAPQQASGARSFIRPRNRTWNIVTQRAFEAYVIPAHEMAKFGRGWWMQEGEWPDVWRWSAKRAWIQLSPMQEQTELRLKFVVPLDVIPHPVTVRFSMNGQVIGTHVATKMDNEVRYVVTPRPKGPNVLRIDVSHTIFPRKLGHDDPRELGIMLHEWSWRRAGPAVLRRAS